MKLFQESSNSLAGRAVLLSVKPIYADLIVAGKKKIEFRRLWAVDNVGLIALYASAPVQKIVALVDVNEVRLTTLQILWKYCKSMGGGISKTEMDTYFSGKEEGYGILLGQVLKLKKPIDPEVIFDDFHAPQSFRYLTAREINKIARYLSS